MLGEGVAPSATHVNANGDALPPPPPVDQPGLVVLRQGLPLGAWLPLGTRLPLGTWLLKSKVVVVALAPPRSARTMPSLLERARCRDMARVGSVERWPRLSTAPSASGSNDSPGGRATGMVGDMVNTSR